MANGTTYMDYEAMAKISSGFQDAGETLNTVAKVLEEAMTILRMTAFIGLVGGAALERFIAAVKPRIEAMAKDCIEMSEKLDRAIATTQQGEQAGNTL